MPFLRRPPSSNHDKHLAVLFACRRDRYLDILAEGGQEVDQAAYGEVAGPIARHSGYLRLRNPKNLPGFRLGGPTLLDDAVDFGSQAWLHQLPVRVGQSKIGKNVAAAFGDGGLFSGFSFGLHLASASLCNLVLRLPAAGELSRFPSSGCLCPI